MAFFAKSSAINSSFPLDDSYGTVILDELLTDAGIAYNTQTGKFAAPEIGYYVFSYKIVLTSFGSNNVVVFRLVTQSGMYATASVEDDSLTEKAVTGTAIILLTQGAEVSLGYVNPGARIRINECWFTGWLYRKN